MADKPTDKQLIAAIKKHWDGDEVHIPTVAEELNVTPASITVQVWRLEPEAKPNCKFTANKGNIVKARKNGIRWERIAARTGKSISEVKEVGGKEAADVYTGRGRPVGSGNTGGGRRSGSTKQSGRGTSGRRQAAGSKPGPGRKPRARTRAAARAKAGDPQ